MPRRSGRTRNEGFWRGPSSQAQIPQERRNYTPTASCLEEGAHIQPWPVNSTGFSMARTTLDHFTAPRFHMRPPESSMWIATRGICVCCLHLSSLERDVRMDQKSTKTKGFWHMWRYTDPSCSDWTQTRRVSIQVTLGVGGPRDQRNILRLDHTQLHKG